MRIKVMIRMARILETNCKAWDIRSSVYQSLFEFYWRRPHEFFDLFDCVSLKSTITINWILFIRIEIETCKCQVCYILLITKKDLIEEPSKSIEIMLWIRKVYWSWSQFPFMVKLHKKRMNQKNDIQAVWCDLRVFACQGDLLSRGSPTLSDLAEWELSVKWNLL